MTADEKIKQPTARPINLCPWLVVFVALLLYGFTLNHWLSLSSLPIVSTAMGWDWHPFPLLWRQTTVAPLFFVLTYPVRLFPMGTQPLVLNVFAAVYAAAALGLLAASVRLLPHDRTREQRQREGGAFALLSIRTAFLPPLFAVLMLGWQLTFWTHAIAATGEMLNLMVFAFLIFSLLRFRISQNDKWLFWFAFIYGLGTVNNWALIGFFSCFLIALVWIKGLNFFNLRFFLSVLGCLVLGLLLYLLIPLIGSIKANGESFWTLLMIELKTQSYGLRSVPRWAALVMVLATLVPLCFAGIRWPSFDGELSVSGGALTRFMFRMLHAIFLVLVLVTFFDSKYSPSLAVKESPVDFLTFFYLGALCVGYFSGYLLLVYGEKPVQSWDRISPIVKGFNYLMVAFVWILAVGVPCKLFYQNFSRVKADNGKALLDFASETLRDLPASHAIILSDEPGRLFLLEAVAQREGKPNQNILIDTGSLGHREYIAYLVNRYPELKKVTTNPEHLRRLLPASALVEFFYNLGRQFPIYYLHPSFGYYFEAFYAIPHGLVYELHSYAKDALQPPLLSDAELKFNTGVWDKLEKGTLARLLSMTNLSADAVGLANDYSLDLDTWGTQLQKAGRLPEANAQFAEAVALNPKNFVAKINQEYNSHLQKNEHQPIDSEDLLSKAMSFYRGLMPILRQNGPPDEPYLDAQVGGMMASSGNLRQAAGFFERRLQLLPGDPVAQLDLAKTFIDLGQPDKAMALVRKLSTIPTVNQWQLSRLEALAYLKKNDWSEAEKILKTAEKENPQDQNRVAILAEFYSATGYTALREKKPQEANLRFETALTNIDRQLQLLTSSAHGPANPFDIPETMMKKAEMQMMLKLYQPAVATLTQVMELQPDNRTALLNRAIAEVQINQLEAARNDYNDLRKLLPSQSYIVDYGLADLAAREKKPDEERRFLKQYLKSAPDDTREFQQVKERLKKLENR